jgi:uncharacterized membrane protein (UPF0136 family)
MRDPKSNRPNTMWEWRTHRPFRPRGTARSKVRPPDDSQDGLPLSWQQHVLDVYHDLTYFAASVYRQDIPRELTPRYTLIGSMVYLVAFIATLGGFMTGYYLFAGSPIGSLLTGLVVGVNVFFLDKMAVSGRKQKKEGFKPGVWIECGGTLLLRLIIAAIIGGVFSTSLVVFMLRQNIQQHLVQDVERSLDRTEQKIARVNKLRWRATNNFDAKGDRIMRDDGGAVDAQLQKIRTDEQIPLERKKKALEKGDPSVMSYGSMLTAAVEMGFTSVDKNGNRYPALTHDGRLHIAIFLMLFAFDSAPIVYKTFFMHPDSVDDAFHQKQKARIETNKLKILYESEQDFYNIIAVCESIKRRRQAEEALEKRIADLTFTEEFAQEEAAKNQRDLRESYAHQRTQTPENAAEFYAASPGIDDHANDDVSASPSSDNVSGVQAEEETPFAATESLSSDDFIARLNQKHRANEPIFDI